MSGSPLDVHNLSYLLIIVRLTRVDTAEYRDNEKADL